MPTATTNPKERSMPFAPIRSGTRWAAVVVLPALLLAAWLVSQAQADDKKAGKLAEPITQGQRIFTCGHSFHVFVPGILADLAKKADIKDHVQVGMSGIGGSRIIQHWDVPEEKKRPRKR
jgi:hypothetical protein